MRLLHIPVYVVTGFLDAGKTTLLNKLLNDRELRDAQMLVLQFESGEEEFSSKYSNCSVMNFLARALEQNPEQVIEQVRDYLLNNPVDEIWVEWNGVVPFARLQALFLHPSLYRLCRIEKVMHLADAGMLEKLLGKTGWALPEQAAGCDFAVVRGVRSGRDYYRVRNILRGLNPGVKLLDIRQTGSIYREVYSKRGRPVNTFCGGILLFIALYLLAATVFKLSQTPVNTIINVFLGIMLQAVPFLLIGVLISSIIQVFVTKEAIERRFPKNPGWGILAAVLGGFCLPVCDCASIPIFRSLVRKGIPMSAAVTFMTAAPVINPVVMLSTYYAFNGNLQIIAARVGLGIAASVLIGLWFAVRPSRAGALSSSFDSIMCSCGCYEGAESIITFRGKVSLLIRHSQAEFFNLGKYLIIGVFVASVFQTTITKVISYKNGTDFAVSLLVMMIMAFLLSLCSSSDAFIARSFASRFPMGAVMGFLVFGPMIDLKWSFGHWEVCPGCFCPSIRSGRRTVWFWRFPSCFFCFPIHRSIPLI
ncbi:MAG: Putative permease [Desulfotomaculum sp. 46_80]|nr:MAG: Putative permease [Desulfotomaculum sp. 46_80]